jgi:hypothetical protein
MKKLIVLIYVIFFSLESFACIVGSPGLIYTGDELIEKSKNIFLIKIIDDFNSEIIEVLKGDKSKYKNFGKRLSNYGMHFSNDFDNHRDIFFWEMNIGRSESHSCSGPEHTYIPGEMYLIFQGQYGARKYAEIIRSFDDNWYLYVKNKIANPQFDHYSLLTPSNKFDDYNHIGLWHLDAYRTYLNMSKEMQEINSYLLNEKNDMKFTNDNVETYKYDFNGNLIDTKSYEYDYRKFNQYLITYLPVGNSPNVYIFENKKSMIFMNESRTKLYFTKTHNQSLQSTADGGD